MTALGKLVLEIVILTMQKDRHHDVRRIESLSLGLLIDRYPAVDSIARESAATKSVNVGLSSGFFSQQLVIISNLFV